MGWGGVGVGGFGGDFQVSQQSLQALYTPDAQLFTD